MHTVNRRSMLGGLVASAICPAIARSDPNEMFEVASGEGQVALVRYAANRVGKRPGVILLHGMRGFELRLRAYERYAIALTAKGIDAYLLHYYAAADIPKMKEFKTSESRVAYEMERYPAWAGRVSSAITAILARGNSSERLGLLGFSLGGFVASATAARDSRISALAVLYGGMPDNMVSQVKHLPAVIELHGEADHNVSLASGEALVALAKSVGAPAEQVKYPGKGHGFDFADDDPATANAVERVSRFFELRLGAA